MVRLVLSLSPKEAARWFSLFFRIQGFCIQINSSVTIEDITANFSWKAKTQINCQCTSSSGDMVAEGCGTFENIREQTFETKIIIEGICFVT